MSVTSGFFNSTNRDRLYNATDFGRFFEGIVTDGVLKDFEDGLEVVNLSVLGFQIRSGKAMFNGVWIISTDLVTLAPAAVTTPDSYGIFAVVAEVNYTTREGSIKLVSTPDIPSSTSLANGVQNVLKPLLRNDAARYSGIHQYVMAIGTRNTAATMFSNFAFLTGQTLASSSPYYSIKDFIAPYAKAKISAFEAFYSSDRAGGNIGNLFEVINTVYDIDNTTQASQVFDVTEDN